MTTNLAELPGKVEKLTRFVLEGRKDAVTNVALFAKEEFLAGPPRTGLRRGARIVGKPWGAWFELEPSGTDYKATVQYRGPVHWWNGGVKPHPIVPTGFVGSRKMRVWKANTGVQLQVSERKVARGGKRALKFGGQVRSVVRHPGHRAHPFWPGVEKRVRAGAPKVLQADLRSSIAKAGFQAASSIRR